MGREPKNLGVEGECSEYPPDTRVVASGYEGGYNDITLLKTIQLQLDAYMGQHDDAEAGEPALLLFGENQLSEEFLSKKKEGAG